MKYGQRGYWSSRAPEHPQNIERVGTFDHVRIIIIVMQKLQRLRTNTVPCRLRHRC